MTLQQADEKGICNRIYETIKALVQCMGWTARCYLTNNEVVETWIHKYGGDNDNEKKAATEGGDSVHVCRSLIASRSPRKERNKSRGNVKNG